MSLLVGNKPPPIQIFSDNRAAAILAIDDSIWIQHRHDNYRVSVQFMDQYSKWTTRLTQTLTSEGTFARTHGCTHGCEFGQIHDKKMFTSHEVALLEDCHSSKSQCILAYSSWLEFHQDELGPSKAMLVWN